MDIFLSWCYTATAEEADMTRQEWLQKVEGSEDPADQDFAAVLTREHCLPEYAQYLGINANRTERKDTFTENLLAVRAAIPQLRVTRTYKLASRLAGKAGLPVAVALRNWLLNISGGEWTGDLSRHKPFNVTFIGLPGLKQFLQNWALACAVHSQFLPVDLWLQNPHVELPESLDLRQLLTACGVAATDPGKAEAFRNLTRGWFGPGASAVRDEHILLAASMGLGFKGVRDDSQ